MWGAVVAAPYIFVVNEERKWYNEMDKSEFADEIFELSLFFKAFRTSYSEMISIFPCFCPYGQFTRESFFWMYLIVACHLIQEPCGSPLCLPCGMGIHIHCGTYVRVSQEFLHVFWRCTVWQQIACVSMPELVEVKALKPVQFLCKRPAYDTQCTRRFKAAVRS